ncbi:hypothetical protein DPMN_164487 [Dreissena polymorpha]|uniref:Uncharacterized protein n=1 Tax=Dreissena polymorpha TaxID=45954 RepID=A0A9D4ITS2_DREPO|nr:hypothetical protein DPMN_164487 [Dreissena polymorpha]
MHKGEHIITPCIRKPGTYSFFARTSTFLSRPNTYQVVSTPCRTVCLANTSSFCQIGHFSGNGQPDFSYVRLQTSSVSESSSHVLLSTSRPICDQRQPHTSSVCESSSIRSSSIGDCRAFDCLRPTGL